MLLLVGISPKCDLTPQKETGYYIFKMTIFSKFFGDFMRHIIGQSAGKKIKYFFELFSNKNFRFTRVIYLAHESLNRILNEKVVGLKIFILFQNNIAFRIKYNINGFHRIFGHKVSFLIPPIYLSPINSKYKNSWCLE